MNRRYPNHPIEYGARCRHLSATLIPLIPASGKEAHPSQRFTGISSAEAETGHVDTRFAVGCHRHSPSATRVHHFLFIPNTNGFAASNWLVTSPVSVKMFFSTFSSISGLPAVKSSLLRSTHTTFGAYVLSK